MENKEIYALCYYSYSNWVENESLIAVSESREYLEEYAKTKTNDTYADTDATRNKLVSDGKSHTFIVSGITFLVAPNTNPVDEESESTSNDDSSSKKEYDTYSYTCNIDNFVEKYSEYYTRPQRNKNSPGITDEVILINRRWYLPNKKISFPRFETEPGMWVMCDACYGMLLSLSKKFKKHDS